VVRATVEAFGPVGDTEMNITIKWPAGSIGVLPSGDNIGSNNSSPTPQEHTPAHKAQDTGNIEAKVVRKPPQN
jgi:hypothetical protein